jgi:hypothetical protein
MSDREKKRLGRADALLRSRLGLSQLQSVVFLEMASELLGVPRRKLAQGEDAEAEGARAVRVLDRGSLVVRTS